MPSDIAVLVRDECGILSLAAIPSRYGVQAFTFTCSGIQSINHWQKLAGLAEQSGYWPVILGDDDDVRRVLGREGRAPEEILRGSSQMSLEQWLAARARLREEQETKLRAIFQKRYGSKADQKWREFEERQASYPQHSLHGEWPEEPQRMTKFTIPYERAGYGPPKSKITVGLFPTKESWEVPAFVGLGGWNECPDAEGHLVMMKSWFEEYGAQLAGMSGDVIEMSVSRPPSRRDAALKLAEQQFLYCEDIVTQGTQTIEALAAGLLDSSIWYFWWD